MGRYLGVLRWMWQMAPAPLGPGVCAAAPIQSIEPRNSIEWHLSHQACVRARQMRPTACLRGGFA